MTRARGPFVLLDDARPGGRTTLFAGLRALVETRDPAEVETCLEQLRGTKASGFLAYEAGHGLEPKLAPLARSPAPDEPPLLWFGSFAEEWTGNAAEFLPDPAGAWAGAARPLISRAEY
jgi:para-aminobenzoate synthetase/4-amino-4-deoxychorismate lyase